MSSEERSYLVSVRLMTFNHADFIKDAMKGILEQKTNFKVEVVIGDDFSTDNTLELINEFSDTENIHFKVLDRRKGDKYFKERQRVGRLYNFYDIIKNCHGKYIALLDGDDYWTDEFKLQKQVDFLEGNEEYIACFHDVCVVNKGNKVIRENKFRKISLHDYDSETLINGRVLPVLSVMFRNVISDLPYEFMYSGLGDKFISSFLGNYGDAKYLNNIRPSAYRVGNHGMWSKSDYLYKKKLNLMTVYQLWRYYDRIGAKHNANLLFNNLLIQGYRMYPYTPSKYIIVKFEKLIMKANFNIFRYLRFPRSLWYKVKKNILRKY